jgi:dynein heavy chain
MYDGDVDALWIENMNSVMDDNKLLTLTNGERIRLEKHCAMLFENFDLQYASPATISRCGMVFVDDKNLGPGPFYDRWCRLKTNEKLHEALEDLYEKYVPPSIALVFSGREGDGPPGDPLPSLLTVCLGGAPGRSSMGMDSVVQLCALFDSLVPDQQNVPMDLVENVYIFCVIWSLGSVLSEKGRDTFDEFVKKTANKIGLPTKTSLYDSFFDIEQGRWISWDDKVPTYDPPANIPFTDVFVPTVDTVRYAWLQEMFMAVNKPVLFVGESGTAKSVTVQACLDSFSKETSLTLNVNFSSRTSSLDFQKIIEDNISKRTGRIFGPEQGKKLRVFVDDLSMPRVDTYGTQQPLALLRFLVDRAFMYERGGDLERIIVKDLQFVSAMQPPGSGRNPIDSRLVCLYAAIGITRPSAAVLDKIFSTIYNCRFAGFSDAVREAVQKLPSLTMQLHEFLRQSLPPTPLKFHYSFNLRDLSRVSQGTYQADPQIYTTAGQIVRLWRNECLRVYEDRLNDMKDKDLCGMQQIPSLVKANFSKIADEVLADPCVFGDFRDALDILIRSDTPHLEVRMYEDLASFENVKGILGAVLENYNVDNKQMSLVLFQDAMSHCLRIHRIIRMARGNALLVGLGGSGKQSMTRLATYTAGYKVFEITLSRGYGDTEFREDLRTFYTGVVKAPLSFLFMDCHVVDDGFLEYINNMLTVGMVPALFGDDEKEPLVGAVRAAAKEAGVQESGMWNFCCGKIRDNMHLCIAMSPAGGLLRMRCRNFPGLVSCNTIDWFFAWPKEALQAVAGFYLEPVEVPEQVRSVLPDFLARVHLSVTDNYSPSFEAKFRRKNFATPKNYLDYLNNYSGFLDQNRKRVDTQSQRLGGGLEKLIEAADQVAVMSKELAAKLIIVDQNAKEVAELLEVIADKSVKVAAAEEQAAAKAKQIEEDTIIINKEKKEADDALEEALPALEKAATALENLDKKDITEIKSMASPPTPVMIVCMCVVILRPLGKEDESAGWAGAKSMLSDTGLLRALQDYKKEDMNARQIKRIRDLLMKEKETFAGENMRKISTAGYGLLQWVNAMVEYYDVSKNVAPKRKLVKDLLEKKEIAEDEQEKITQQLEELSAQITALAEDEKSKSAELKGLKDDAESMQRKLHAASQLIEGLGSERERWTEELKSLSTIKMRLDGDCLVTAAFVSYAGAFNMEFRQQMVYTDWLGEVTTSGIPRNPEFRLETLLTSDIEVAAWSGQGLPQDELSVQNGILTTRSSRWPLCVDPQMQAVSWIKRKEEKAGLTVKTLNDEYVKYLELAIQYGKPILFENLDEELDPMLDPVLEKAYVIVAGAKMFTLGDNTIEWNESFILYMTTKLANPRYSPETMGKVSIVNYMVTLDGLAAQLLNVVVGFERPDLEKERQKLVQDMSDNKQVLKTLEDTLLRELAGSKVPILENDDLIATLNTAKTKSVEIGESLVAAAQTAAEMEKTRSLYEKVARRGSILYFTMQGMPMINQMYEYSLNSYLGVFEHALKEAKPDRIIDNRLKNLREKLTQSMYDYTCTGTFETHKLLFSFKMTTMIMQGENELIAKEFDFLLKGNPSLDKVAAPKPYDWLTDTGWKDLQLLNNLDPVFKNLVKDVISNEAGWKAWYDEETPEYSAMPGHYAETDGVDPFKQLLVLRCFRNDRIVNAVKNFICWRLNDYYVQPPSLVYDRIFAQSSEKSPICFILSPGADPMSSVQKLGEQLGFVGTKFKFVSLGQGMGPHAAALMETGYQRGHWVLLQNCHLLTSWLKSLEKILEGMTKPHKDFRLWLTTLPLDVFPLGILQKSLKVVTEPPEGLRLNMRQSYTTLSDADLDQCRHSAYKPLIFVLAFYHAVVQDRRKFGRIGWNVAYDFNESDFRISVKLISMYLDKAEELGELIPWETLRYLIGEAMYGGRVTDDFDRRVLNCYLEEYMGDFLFSPDQPFFFSEVGYAYNVPRTGDHALYSEKIKAMPMVQQPAVFGLHPNAEITFLTTAVKDMWEGMLSMSTGDGGGGGEGSSREDYILKLSNEIQGYVPESEVKFLKEGVPTPQEVVLMQELERFIRLSDKIYATLADLKRAVSGEIGMSADLEELGNGLFNGRVFAQWLKLAPQSVKPLGSWIDHFRTRHQQYKDWAEKGDPKVYWLSGLHVPESLLSALVQATSRRKNWALDKSTLYTTCTKFTDQATIAEPLLDGAYVRGLHLEGARWDLEKNCLTTSRPKELSTEMPIIEVIPVEANRLKIRDSLLTPVYVTPLRRNAMGVGLVFSANLNAKEHLSLWILQGVALVLNTED